MKSFWRLFFIGILYVNTGFTAATHIQHVIENQTPFEFYYVVLPTTEIPTAFSCACEGLIGPGEKQKCDCLSSLDSTERRFRMEYMKNTSPTYRLSATHNVESNAVITWKLSFDAYWDWLSVYAIHTRLS